MYLYGMPSMPDKHHLKFSLHLTYSECSVTTAKSLSIDKGPRWTSVHTLLYNLIVGPHDKEHTTDTVRQTESLLSLSRIWLKYKTARGYDSMKQKHYTNNAILFFYPKTYMQTKTNLP